jgi:hypothetical protein
MTFESIVRKWCRTYRPMLDSPRNRRFFFTDSKENMIEMAKGWTPEMSPCVVMECVAEGDGRIERMSMNYPIYFFVRAAKAKDGDMAALAVREALAHMNNFLGWLRDRRNKELDEGRRDGDFARIELDDAFLSIMTIGPIQDGWYAELLQIDREEPLNLCVNEDLYIEDCDDGSPSHECP